MWDHLGRAAIRFWSVQMGVLIAGGTPKSMFYKGKSHLEMDDLAVPLFQETSESVLRNLPGIWESTKPTKPCARHISSIELIIERQLEQPRGVDGRPQVWVARGTRTQESVLRDWEIGDQIQPAPG